MDGACEDGAPLKKAKLQYTAKVSDDAKLEDFQSKYSLSEILRLVPIPLLEELLDFLDIHHSTRLCRWGESDMLQTTLTDVANNSCSDCVVIIT